MSDLIIKTSLQPVSLGGIATFAEQPRRGTYASAGERAFIWFSESQSGPGLTAAGQIVEYRSEGTVAVRVEEVVTAPVLGNGELAAYRDGGDDPAMVELSGLLYRHAHNKIAPLSQMASQVLAQRRSAGVRMEASGQ